MNTFLKGFLIYLVICLVVVGYWFWRLWVLRRRHVEGIHSRLDTLDPGTRPLTYDEEQERGLLLSELEEYGP